PQPWGDHSHSPSPLFQGGQDLAKLARRLRQKCGGLSPAIFGTRNRVFPRENCILAARVRQKSRELWRNRGRRRPTLAGWPTTFGFLQPQNALFVRAMHKYLSDLRLWLTNLGDFGMVQNGPKSGNSTVSPVPLLRRTHASATTATMRSPLTLTLATFPRWPRSGQVGETTPPKMRGAHPGCFRDKKPRISQGKLHIGGASPPKIARIMADSSPKAARFPGKGYRP